MYAIGANAQNANVAPYGQPTMSYYTGSPQAFQTVPQVYQPAVPQMYQPVAPQMYQPVAPQAFQSPAVVPVSNRTVAAPRRTVYRTARSSAPVYRQAPVYREVERTPQRSKTKTALVIGGSAASGAGLGAIIGGKKGALVGAVLGGGAASIYEATRRR